MISSIKLKNFRSFDDSVFKFNKGLNFILGNNGAGKTNLLEAIYYVSRFKSFKVKDNDLIKHGYSYFKLEAELSFNKTIIKYTDKPTKKDIIINNKSIKRTVFNLKQPIVFFDHKQLLISDGSPDIKRQYLDSVLSGVYRDYSINLLKYNKVLYQRNFLLKSKNVNQDQLFPWNIKLVELAEYINNHRRNIVDNFNKNLTNFYNNIARQKEIITTEYCSSINDNSNYINLLLSQLETNFDQEKSVGYTLFGPHKDYYNIYINNKPINLVASRGEIRSVVLAIKQAEFFYIKNNLNKDAILLLDDVYSELDVKRQHNFSLLNYAPQSICTTNYLLSKNLDVNIVDL